MAAMKDTHPRTAPTTKNCNGVPAAAEVSAAGDWYGLISSVTNRYLFPGNCTEVAGSCKRTGRGSGDGSERYGRHCSARQLLTGRKVPRNVVACRHWVQGMKFDNAVVRAGKRTIIESRVGGQRMPLPPKSEHQKLTTRSKQKRYGCAKEADTKAARPSAAPAAEAAPVA